MLMSGKNIYYKGMRVNSFGLPILNETKINNKKNSKRYYHPSFFSPFKKSSIKNMIVMYDVPIEKKKERDWFRRHLKKFNYTMIQKSVWVGPSPLPTQFMDYVKSIGLKEKIKTFKLAKNYTEKDTLI